MLSVVIYSIKKKIKWRLTIILSLWGLIGAASGIMLTKYLGGEITSKLFGALLIIMGIYEIFKRNNKSVAEREK